MERRETPACWTALVGRVREIHDVRFPDAVAWDMRRTLLEALMGRSSVTESSTMAAVSMSRSWSVVCAPSASRGTHARGRERGATT